MKYAVFIYSSKLFTVIEFDENVSVLTKLFQTLFCLSINSDKETAQVEIMLSFSGPLAHSLEKKIDILLGISF